MFKQVTLSDIEPYEKKRILEDLERTYTERFRLMMQLIRLQQKIKRATIVHKKML